MRKTSPLFLILFFITVCQAYAQSPAEIYGKANLNYTNEKYEKAVSLYETLIEMDGVSPEVFYNLGNAYFKLKKIGKAIINYRRALELSPGDRDILRNLDLARTMIVDKIERPEKGFLIRIALFPYERMNVNQVTVLVSFFYLCIVTLLIFAIFFVTKRKALFYTAGVIAAALLLLSVFFIYKIRGECSREAVVVADKVEVRSGPKEDYLSQFTLHEGAELKITEEGRDWYEIGISKDLRGWIPKDSVEII